MRELLSPDDAPPPLRTALIRPLRCETSPNPSPQHLKCLQIGLLIPAFQAGYEGSIPSTRSGFQALIRLATVLLPGAVRSGHKRW